MTFPIEIDAMDLRHNELGNLMAPFAREAGLGQVRPGDAAGMATILRQMGAEGLRVEDRGQWIYLVRASRTA